MKTILIGLDGATFSLLDSFMTDGVMPFLAELVARGVRAQLLSVTPPVTYPAWVSLTTGRSPGIHGVIDFVKAEETDHGLYVKMIDSRDIRCETIWAMVSRQDRTVTSLNFPVTFPTPVISGSLIPGFVSWRHLRRAVYPLSLYEKLRSLPGFDGKEIAWDVALEKKAVQTLPPEEYEDWIRFQIRRQEQWFGILRYLMQTSPSDLTAYLDDTPDKICHLAWRFVDPSLYADTASEWERNIRDICLSYFRQLDRCLAEIATIAGTDARIFLVSDHGFGPTWEVFYVNVWLHQHGYLYWGEGGAYLDDSEEIFARQTKTQLLDWERTLAYAPTPSSNGIRIRVSKKPGEPGITPENYESFREELIALLLRFTDPESGEPIVKRVLKKEEVYPGDNVDRVPDLTLILRDHGFISILNSDKPLKSRKEIKGTHRPEGIFIAAGPGIRPGALPPLSLLDVCPTLLYSLGLDVPVDLEGRLVEEVFESSLIKRYPPIYRGVTKQITSPALQSVEDSLSSEEEAALLSRLKALGYLE